MSGASYSAEPASSSSDSFAHHPTHGSLMYDHHHHAHMAGTPASTKPISPHMLHLIATLITGGLWLPIWIYYALFWKKKPAGSDGSGP